MVKDNSRQKPKRINSRWSSDLAALFDIATHLTTGPRSIFPPNDPAARAMEPFQQWLEPFLQMSEFRMAAGPHFGLSLYTVPNMTCPTEFLPFIRRSEWQRGEDRDRLRAGEHLKRPDMITTYFSVPRNELGELDAAIKDLDESLRGLDFRMGGLELDRLYGPPAPETIAVELPVPPRHRRWLRRATAYGVQVWWLEDTDSGLDAAWEQVWEMLQSLCRLETKAEGVMERWNIPPEDYAEMVWRVRDQDGDQTGN